MQVSDSAWQSSRASPKHTTEDSRSPPARPAGSASQCNYPPLRRLPGKRCRWLALEDEQLAGLVLGSVGECGQRCLDPGETRFGRLLAHVLEGRNGAQLQ